MGSICKNCNAEVSGKYCNHCGQRTTVGEVSFKETFQDIINAVFAVDAPIIITFKLLFLNPGKLYSDFLSGKRKRYYKPVSFFIFTTVLFVLLSSLLNYNPFSGMNALQTDQDEIDLLIVDSFEFFAKNINNMLLIFVFTYGAWFKLFFLKKIKFIEAIVIAFYTVGFYTFFTTLSMVTLEFVSYKFQIVSFIITAIFIVYGNISFFKKRSFSIVIKSIFTYLFSFVSFSLLGGLLSYFILWLKK